MRFSFVSNNAMEILPIDKRQQSSSCWPLYCSLYAPKLWNPQCERQNWNNFVLFFHHSEAEESVAFVSYLPCRPLVSLIHNTCICVYVYMCLRLYVPHVGIAMPRLCHPNVRPFTAASILYLYTHSKYLLSNPVCCLVQANPGPLCSSRSRYERALPLHIPRLHIECIYCATYILCAYRSFSFSFRITLPSPPCARCQWLQ